jgi:hypothetical protein
LTPAPALSTDPAVGLRQRRFGSSQVRPTSTDFIILVMLENYIFFFFRFDFSSSFLGKYMGILCEVLSFLGIFFSSEKLVILFDFENE